MRERAWFLVEVDEAPRYTRHASRTVPHVAIAKVRMKSVLEPNAPHSREPHRQTLIPPFDALDLARELDGRGTLAIPNVAPRRPPFDPAAYARIVDADVSVTRINEPHPDDAFARTIAPPRQTDDEDTIDRATAREGGLDGLGRRMYGAYLASEYPAALVFAEQLLAYDPEHALALTVADRCREQLEADVAQAVDARAIVRVRRDPLVSRDVDVDPEVIELLAQLDGVVDVATLAYRAGLPLAHLCDQLTALVDLGFVEVVGH